MYVLRTDYAYIPQRCVYVMPLGSNIDVARCGWESGIKSNGRYNVRLKSHLRDVSLRST
ncbi:MAG: hypothetical protein K2N20_04625 [Helicobacter sp.]|nr:hypothetical protein [Helicobacter sp.]